MIKLTSLCVYVRACVRGCVRARVCVFMCTLRTQLNPTLLTQIEKKQ